MARRMLRIPDELDKRLKIEAARRSITVTDLLLNPWRGRGDPLAHPVILEPEPAPKPAAEPDRILERQARASSIVRADADAGRASRAAAAELVHLGPVHPPPGAMLKKPKGRK